MACGSALVMISAITSDLASAYWWTYFQPRAQCPTTSQFRGPVRSSPSKRFGVQGHWPGRDRYGLRVGLRIGTVAVLVAAGVGFGSPVMATVDLDEVAEALRQDPLYVDPTAERALSAADAARVREAIAGAGTPVYIAVLPASADEAFGGDPAALASALADSVDRNGTLAVVVGDSLRAGSSVLPAGRAAELATDALAVGGDDTTGVLVDFVRRVAAEAPVGSTPPAVVANDPDLDSLLLRLDDLPTGWSIAPRQLFDGHGEYWCGDVLDSRSPSVAGLPRASASFLSDSLIDVVAETILHADSSDAARAIVDEIAEAFEACAVAVDADGVSVSYSEMSFPQLGDSTVAYRAIPHSSSPPVSLALVAVAVGDKVVLFVGGGAGGDFSLFEQLAATAVDRAR
jgi:hypothetical protein